MHLETGQSARINDVLHTHVQYRMDDPMENKQRKATAIGFSFQSYDSFRENKPLQILLTTDFSAE